MMMATSLGGICGVVFNKNMDLVYLFSGPCEARSAFQAELLVLLHLGEVLEIYNVEYLICVDSQQIEISFLKAKARRFLYLGFF